MIVGSGCLMKTIHYLYVSVACFFCFFFLTIFIINGNLLFFDLPSYRFLSHFSFTPFLKFITDFGNVHYLLFFLFLTFFLFQNKSHWKFLLFMMLLEVISNIVLKNFFTRPRPNVVWLIEETGFSFPSGHMMASTMFYGLCIYFLMESDQNRFLKFLGSFLLVLLIFFIGVSRIYLGVHYTSDVVGGLLISLCFLNFGIFFYRSTHPEKKIELTS